MKLTESNAHHQSRQLVPSPLSPSRVNVHNAISAAPMIIGFLQQRHAVSLKEKIFSFICFCGVFIELHISVLHLLQGAFVTQDNFH
mmetsp:Transcript_1420/g.2027  ORF Transcript_1420/g.2027 Transcript_1420/m.2027 type:complete len:86 (+) Transcript_1420:67-324(+)